MAHDDAPRGHVLTRREALALLGVTGAAFFGRSVAAFTPLLHHAAPAWGQGAAGTAPSTGAAAWPATPAAAASPAPGAATSCIVRPGQTEGPYFVDELLLRSDIRSDPSDGSTRPGAELRLAIHVSALLADSSCIPLAGAYVDLWHCDALGVYSDVQDPGFDTLGKKFLRGYQITDPSGVASFVTIYPGWYLGRTVHMHVKIRSAPATSPGFEFTSQLYFDDALTDQVHAQQPYASKGQRTFRNDADGLYRQGGSQLLLAVSLDGSAYVSTLEVALQGVVSVRPGTWSGVKTKYS
jgi:protocatechuate 3,4-dioxygenase beta subunit